MDFPFLGFGLGLRTRHYNTILEHWPQVDWFEAISENYMVAGGRPIYTLNKIRERYPVVLHGVSLSIGSTDPLNQNYLRSLKKLIHEIKPVWVSDHLCWTGVGGHNLHDLLPLPYTEEALKHVIERVKQVQNFLGQQILLENVSSYLEFTHSTFDEAQFLSEVAEKADCKILLDINNIYVSSVNHSFDPLEYLKNIPKKRVVQFHLAGHSHKGTYLLDTHDHPIRKDVWALYQEALKYFGPVSTLIERDDHIPSFPILQKELTKAKALYQEIYDSPRTKSPNNTKASLEAHYSA